ncbi:hypothetical protein F8M49_17245 [Rhodococcus zopfii]|uniref:DNA primase/polymerase bifunctional N-terminal domain-containing protein n=1 Tax=Rhodococcus zopfii TaxID=43772 RepID=A0ABU3WSQ6_9NOCA|nr:hypothetical protein [Rhodococcus zopfii]
MQVPEHEQRPLAEARDQCPRDYNTERGSNPLELDTSARVHLDTSSQFPCWQTHFGQRDYLAFTAKFYVEELHMPIQPDWGILNSGSCQCADGHQCPRAGKHPAIKDPRGNATYDLDQIHGWIRQGRNLAAAPLGYLIVDIELGGIKDGLTPFVLWCELAGLDVGSMLSTFAVRSGSGGIHLYFWLPSNCVPPQRDGPLASRRGHQDRSEAKRQDHTAGLTPCVWEPVRARRSQ